MSDYVRFKRMKPLNFDDWYEISLRATPRIPRDLNIRAFAKKAYKAGREHARKEERERNET